MEGGSQIANGLKYKGYNGKNNCVGDISQKTTRFKGKFGGMKQGKDMRRQNN